MPTVLRSRLFPVALTACAACVVGVASAYFAATVLLDDRGARAQGVEVSGADGVVIDQGVTPREALKIASDKLGYEVKGLGFTPGSGFQLQRIVLSRRIYDYSPREAMLDYTSPDPTADHGALRIAVIQTDRPDTHPANWQPKDDPNRPFDIGVPGVEAWVSGDQLRRVYSLNVGQRSFTVVIDQRQPPDDDVRRMIRELID